MSLVVLLGLVGAQVAGAQVPTRPPAPADTVRRPPTDTTRRRDSTAVVLPAVSPRTDSARAASIDSVHGIPDSLHTPKPRRDSIQAPLAHAELPTLVGVGPLYRWTRDSVYTTGAVNLADLLERIPGVTVFRSGFLASAQTAAYNGDPARIRVFRDGLELDTFDPRAGGVRDVGDVQLTNVGEIVVERAAGELRVYMRTWTVVSTTPYTRVDAFTGDEDTNLYRFFFGRRFGRGFDAQMGVQQFGTGARSRRVGGGGNVLDALGRLGWARRDWTADLVYSRLDRERDLTTLFVSPDDSVLPRSQGRTNDVSLRVAYRDPDSTGIWAQAIANTTSFTLANTSQQLFVDSLGRRAQGTLVRDTLTVADSASRRRQYVLSGGYSLGRIRLSATDRLRVFDGASLNAPSVRGSFDSRLLSASVFAERDAVGGYVVDSVSKGIAVVRDTLRTVDGKAVHQTVTDTLLATFGAAEPPRRVTRMDGSLRFSPLPWLALIGSASQETRTLSAVLRADTTPDARKSVYDSITSSRKQLITRLEAAVRYRRLWLSGGIVRRGADSIVPPRVYETIIDADGAGARPIGMLDPATTGIVFAARGPIYKDVYLDVNGTRWASDSGPLRPQYQLRGEIGVLTNWLRKFPSGNFGFKAAIVDEYRSRVAFPSFVQNAESLTSENVFAPPTNVLNVQVDIRIQTGTLSYQLKNALNRQYELVPGLRMPGPVSYYGVRWTFFN